MEENEENEENEEKMEHEEISDASFFKRLVKSYWQIFILFFIGLVGAIVGLFLVFYWTLANNWVGGYGTWGIGQFSIGNILGLLIVVGLFELLLVGLPFVAYEGIIFYIWWTRLLTQEEKDRMKRKDEKEKKYARNGAGAFSFVVNLVFLLIVFVNGNWETPIGNLPYVYWINTYLWALFWILVIPGALGLIGGIWYFIKKVE
jgi:hypothetical protein